MDEMIYFCFYFVEKCLRYLCVKFHCKILGVSALKTPFEIFVPLKNLGYKFPSNCASFCEFRTEFGYGLRNSAIYSKFATQNETRFERANLDSFSKFAIRFAIRSLRISNFVLRNSQEFGLAPGQQLYSANMLAANKLLAQHSRQWKIPRQHEVYSQPN